MFPLTLKTIKRIGIVLTIKLPGPSFWQKNDDYEIRNEDCKNLLITDHPGIIKRIHLTFLDPPFNQGKEYDSHDDNMSEKDYWDWMTHICELIYKKTVKGGAIYFMQREKNAGSVIRTLVDSGWTFQNLIIWRKRSAAVPSSMRYAKHYQIIAYATKEAKPRVFNKLRIDPPYASRVHPGSDYFKAGYRRKHGMALTDVWDDIRELTSGFFSGEEPLRHIVPQIFPKCKKCNKEKFTIHVRERAHKQQSPIALLTRIILSSTKIGDLVFDPFAGTGTTSVVARHLKRQSVSVELDSKNVELIHKRIKLDRAIDDIEKLRGVYHLFTTKQHGSNVDLEEIWEKKAPKNIKVKNSSKLK